MPKKRTDNPRPRLGRRLVGGLGLWTDLLPEWARAGFIPADWTATQARDAFDALDYLLRLVAWYERLDAARKGKE